MISITSDQFEFLLPLASVKEGKELSDQEIQFLVELKMRWIEGQIGAEKIDE